MYIPPSAEELKSWRLSIGLTHTEVNRLTGICTAHISRLENNKNVSYWVVKQLVELYLEFEK